MLTPIGPVSPVFPPNKIITNPDPPWGQAPAASVGFEWPDSNPNDGTATQFTARSAIMIATSTPAYASPLQSPHPNVIVVTFCDGHAESIPIDTPCIPNPGNPDAVIFQGAP
jgi:prepilin-type processing-associated H-X9-DG protein